ncbi:MAG: aldo/keto reductase [Anaerolineae bacterium]|nr:aldo/keto reductase [Anaerolineae bacterium]
MEKHQDLVPLGKTDIMITTVGVGAWAWGDRMVWGYGGSSYSDADIREAFDVSLANGTNWFDTAEIYGMGRSERFLGEFLPTTTKEVLVATKFFPFPWWVRKEALLRRLKKSLARLQLNQVDLYQIHMPFVQWSKPAYVSVLADAVHTGLARAVGVSNFNTEKTKLANQTLQAAGVPLASNQVEYSLFDRRIEKNGLLDYCLKNDITVIAYSPLAKGMVTGKYGPDNPPPGPRKRMYPPEKLSSAQPLLTLLKEIGTTHEKTPAQVALNWTICKGTVPIPGAKNARQAADNLGAMGWRLTPEEVTALDEASKVLA